MVVVVVVDLVVVVVVLVMFGEHEVIVILMKKGVVHFCHTRMLSKRQSDRHGSKRGWMRKVLNCYR